MLDLLKNPSIIRLWEQVGQALDVGKPSGTRSESSSRGGSGLVYNDYRTITITGGGPKLRTLCSRQI